MINWEKVKESIKLPLIIGIIIVFLYQALLHLALPLLPSNSLRSEYISFLVNVLLPRALFFPFFLWAGYRSAKEFHCTWKCAGLAAAITAFLLIIAQFLINASFDFVLAGRLQGDHDTLLQNMTAEHATQLSGVYSGIYGAVTLLSASFCLMGAIISAAINFFVGAAGWFFANRPQRKNHNHNSHKSK